LTTVDIYPNGSYRDLSVKTPKDVYVVDLIHEAFTPTYNVNSVEDYLSAHASDQTREQVTEIDINTSIEITSTNKIRAVAYLVLFRVNSTGLFTTSGGYTGSVIGLVDSLMAIVNYDPWSVEVLGQGVAFDAMTSGLYVAKLKRNYTVSPKLTQQGICCSDATERGNDERTQILLIVHDSQQFAGSCTLTERSALHLRKNITYRNDTLALW